MSASMDLARECICSRPCAPRNISHLPVLPFDAATCEERRVLLRRYSRQDCVDDLNFFCSQMLLFLNFPSLRPTGSHCHEPQMHGSTREQAFSTWPKIANSLNGNRVLFVRKMFPDPCPCLKFGCLCPC